MWFIGVDVEQKTSAPPPKKNPGSAPRGWYISALTDMIKYVKIKIWYHNSLLFVEDPVNRGENEDFSDGIVGEEKSGIFLWAG